MGNVKNQKYNDIRGKIEKSNKTLNNSNESNFSVKNESNNILEKDKIKTDDADNNSYGFSLKKKIKIIILL